MWTAILGDLFFIAFTAGTVAYSIAIGRLIYRGTRNITRADDPWGFWGWIAFMCGLCAFVLWLSSGQIFGTSPKL